MAKKLNWEKKRMDGIALPFRRITLACLFLSISPGASATGIPVVDGLANTVAVQKMISDVKAWARDEVMKRMQMKTDISLSESEQATEENIAANTIVRITDAIQTTHNKKIAAEMTPTFMACKNVSVARAQQSSAKSAEAETARSLYEFYRDELRPPGTSKNAYINSVNKKLTAEMDSINDSLQGSGREQAYLRADSFLQLGTFDDLIYSEPENDAAKVFMELLVGPYSERSRLLLSEKSLAEMTPKDRVKLSREVIRKSVLMAILESIRGDFIDDGEGNSKALARYDFIYKSRLASPSWHKKITCTGASGKPSECATDSAMLKEIGAMQAEEMGLMNDLLFQRKLSNLLGTLQAAD